MPLRLGIYPLALGEVRRPRPADPDSGGSGSDGRDTDGTDGDTTDGATDPTRITYKGDAVTYKGDEVTYA